MMALFDLIRLGAGGVISALGLVLVLGGALGVLRFPDFYTRLHALRVADGLGAVLVLIGLAIVAGDWAISLRLVLMAALIMALGPVLAHVGANTAHTSGLAPLTGPYRAPRPGAPREGS